MGVESRDPEMLERFLGLSHLDEDESVTENDDNCRDEEVADVHDLDHHGALLHVPENVVAEWLQAAEEGAQKSCVSFVQN